MIKQIILDVDGVIIGGKPGVNFPLPHPEVVQSLQKISRSGKLISFCTAKPGFAIKELVNITQLDSIHISNGGAEIINQLENKIIDVHYLDKNTASQLVSLAKQNNLYTEAYTIDGYTIQKDHYAPLTDINVSILQTPPQIVNSLEDFVSNHDLTKIMHAAYTYEEKNIITTVVNSFPDLQLQWGGNPMYAPTLFAVVTKKGITKQTGAKEISNYTKISLEETLGVGDGLSDWDFMQLCGYVATVDNAGKEVKDLINSRVERGYIGGSVDQNGILDIFRHFGF